MRSIDDANGGVLMGGGYGHAGGSFMGAAADR